MLGRDPLRVPTEQVTLESCANFGKVQGEAIFSHFGAILSLYANF